MSRTPRVLILHAYSADNAGDGLLVRETLALLEDAFGTVDATMLASRPDSFADLGIPTFPTVPTRRGWDRRTRAILARLDEFDLVVGVGGGYLRAGTPVELLKAALVMGPQLWAASRSTTPTVYLPQSIGPARFGTRRVLTRLLRGIDVVMVRDDRTFSEVAGPTLVRTPDLAAASIAEARRLGARVEPKPVLSIRSVHGRINPDIYALARRIAPYDGYIQSTIGGNDDRPAAATLSPARTIERSELLRADAAPRVIVAVRLHAALMALAAGHYVVHLAYERKGFGAFDDLGIAPWVHRVNGFDVDTVHAQVTALLTDEAVRDDYDTRLRESAGRIGEARKDIVLALQNAIEL